MPADPKSKLGPFLYFWLAMSVLLNISGLASIVDGFVVWVGFLRNFIEIYRAWIREPMLWAAHLVWPNGWPRIPGWIMDWLCISGSFALAVNAIALRDEGQTFIGVALEAGDNFAQRIVFVFLAALVLLAGPLLFPLLWLSRMPREAWGTLGAIILTWTAILGGFVLLIFLNWQLKRAGAW
jgi:hypothetical protein